MFRFSIFTFLSIFAVCLFTSCEDPQPQREVHKKHHVETITLKKTHLHAILRLPGQLYPYEAVDLYAKVPGFIDNLPVDRGSIVHQGDLLVTLIAPELIQNWEAAKAKYESDHVQYERLKKAAQVPGTIAPIELEIAEKAMEASLKTMYSLKDTASYLTLTAPFSGVITTRYLHPGAIVGPHENPIMRLVDVYRLRLVVYIPQAYLESIRDNMEVSFLDSSHPETLFSATLSRVAHSLDLKTRTEPVELDVYNPTMALSPGSYIDVLWPITRPYPTFLVPSSAVITTTYNTFVIRIRGDKTEWVDVKRGYQYDHLVEIFGPLEEGDLITTQATDELKPGTQVETVQ